MRFTPLSEQSPFRKPRHSPLGPLVAVIVFGGLFAFVVARALLSTPAAGDAGVRGDYSALVAEGGQPVVLIEMEGCGYCDATREMLGDRGVPHAVLNVDDSDAAQRFMADHRIRGVPIVVTRDAYVVGYDPETITAIVAQATSTTP